MECGGLPPPSQSKRLLLLQAKDGMEASLHAQQREPFDFAQDKQAPVQGEPALHANGLAASELFNELLRQDTG